MARKTVVADQTHREEQREYRNRLGRENRPEVGRVDTAVSAAFYAYLRRIKQQQRGREGKADGDFLLQTALDVLVEMGRERKKRPEPYDRKASLKVLRRRLAKTNERFDRLLGFPDEDEDAHQVSCP